PGPVRVFRLKEVFSQTEDVQALASFSGPLVSNKAIPFIQSYLKSPLLNATPSTKMLSSFLTSLCEHKGVFPKPHPMLAVLKQDTRCSGTKFDFPLKEATRHDDLG